MGIIVEYVCRCCGKVGSTINGLGKYCSQKCQQSFQRAKIIESWQAGVGKIGPKTLRKYFISTYGHRCCNCGLTEWQGKPIPLNLDHIDGNSDNDKEENLRLLCLNCDGQTPTYGARNTGSGRKLRRLQYKRLKEEECNRL